MGAFGSGLAIFNIELFYSETKRTEGYSMKGTCLLFSAAALSAVFLTGPAHSQNTMRAAAPANASADNTAQNVRDKGGNTMTSTSQSESKSDLKMAADIRRAIVKDKRLSTNAKNIKVITDNGRVTLRGPVNSSQEKTLIAAKASAIAAAGNVDNQLDIANQ
jgi:osmotically-inducible protein OsmY